MADITYKYSITLPDTFAKYYTADTSLSCDSSRTVDATKKVFSRYSVTIPELVSLTVDSMDITVDDTTITVDYTALWTPVTRYRIYLPYTIGKSFTADSSYTADSSITVDTTIL